MILYRKEPIPLQMKNIMLLDDVTTGGVVYVNKATYDQALLLHSRFDGNISRVIDILRNKKTEAYIAMPGLKGLIENMGKTMPEPINMLAPFLMFCVQNQGITWDADNREMAYGILHQYSTLIDFNSSTLVPTEVRLNISLPTAILLNYQVAWDDLCSTLEDKVVMVTKAGKSVSKGPSTSNVVEEPKKVVAEKIVEESVEDTEDEELELEEGDATVDADEFAKFMASLNASNEAFDKKSGELEKKRDEPAPTQSSSLTADAAAEEKKAVNSILDEYEGL